MFPTPTPIPIQTPVVDIGVNIEQFGQDMASGVIQGFNLFDSQGFAGVIWFVLLGLLIIGGIVSIRKHLDTL